MIGGSENMEGNRRQYSEEFKKMQGHNGLNQLQTLFPYHINIFFDQ